MKCHRFSPGLASLVSLCLIANAQAQGQFGGQKKGFAQQQGGGMQHTCGKGQGSSTQGPTGQTSSMQTPFGGSGTQNPFASSNFARRNSLSQGTGTQYPIGQNVMLQFPFSQSNGVMPFPPLQNGFPYVMNQYPGMQATGGTDQSGYYSSDYATQDAQNYSVPTQSAVQTNSLQTMNTQRIQQRRNAAQAQNVQLLRFSGQ